jgi:OmcA/MtrC family decaheme c-type cytochrome
MISSFLRSAVIFIAALVVIGCDGDTGSAGAPGAQGPPGPQGPPGSGPGITIPSNATPATDAAAATWANLSLRVTVTDVRISSPPVVDFTVTDANGTPVVGLGNTSKSSTDTVAGLSNLRFAVAKLVPGANGAPSEWVSYIVTTVPSTTAAAAPTRPTTDNTGTLVDNGDGTYTYTFYRDVPAIASQVAGMTVSGSDNKADLGDLTYASSLVHRLTIQLSGSAPGTGTNTPDAVEVVGYPGVPLEAPIDVIYDFVPATGQPAANSGRDIVATQKCNECHQTLGGIPGDSPESSAAGFHGGNRNETRYCVVCHTEQRKYGRTEATYDSSTLTFTSTSTYRVDGRALGVMPNNIHHIHMGKLLAKKNYNYAGTLYNEVLFPQDTRNCTKCHDGSATSTAPTAQGDNWKNAPNQRACGGCHDGINFATGMGVTIADALEGLTETTSFNGFAHGGQSQADDSNCTICHTPGNIDVVHLPITPPNPENSLDVPLQQGENTGNSNTNAAWIASNAARLPAGSIKITYDIKSVTRDANRQPVMVFRILQNGARQDFKAFVPPAPTGDLAQDAANLIAAQGAQEMLNNFMGSPSAYFVFAVPEDGIAAPADFNATASGYLRSLWNGAASGSGAGTLTGPDTDGYYTVTLTGVTVPDSAVMLTGGMGFSYNARNSLPLTQTNLADYPVTQSTLPVSPVVPVPSGSPDLDPRMANKRGGLIVIAPNVTGVASAGCTAGTAGGCTSSGGYTGRRPIVEDARCNKCHQELGTFTEEAFHGAQRNDGTTCAWCHTPNRTSSGWSADSTSFIHAIHGGAKREVPFTWHASSTTESFADIQFPGILRKCETCHLPGTYDFSAAASASALPNRLYKTVATGLFNGTAGTLTTGCTVTAINNCLQTEVGAYSLSPYVIKDNATSYGSGFSVSAGVPTDAAGTTLVNSPITTQCFSCHDSVLARAHMEVNGGSIYVPRSTALGTIETCQVCHDDGRIADIEVMHAK